MTDSDHGSEPQKRVNPRSICVATAGVFTKTSSSVDLEAEALELERCASMGLNTAHVLTPELISFDKPTNSLRTKRIKGDQLFLTLWNPTTIIGQIKGKKFTDKGLLTSRMKEIGSWLYLYHESSSADSDQLQSAIEWMRESATSKIKGMRDNKLASASLLRRIEQRLLSDIEGLSVDQQSGVRLCKIHGDFIVYNMMIDSAKNIHVLDFGDTRIGCNLDDIVRLYSNLWAIAHTALWRKKLFLGFSEQMLTSYGLDREIVDLPYFRAQMSYNFLIHAYGHFYMKDLLSFTSNLDLSRISGAGMLWIEKNYI